MMKDMEGKAIDNDTFNSLAPGRCDNFKSVISEHMSRIKFMTTSCEIANTVNATEHPWC